MKIAKPQIIKIKNNFKSLKQFEEDKTISVELNGYPVVYIHAWKEKGLNKVYVGESNDIFQRTKQHYEVGKSNKKCWQSHINNDNADLYVIGHEHFNKSLTLDIENRLIHYLSSAHNIDRVFNGRGNPQGNYYPVNEFDTIFSKIWRSLRNYNKELFPTKTVIEDSAIFKASPLHKLTKDQLSAQALIIDKVQEALVSNEMSQLIFIEGSAGTGKTVLNSSTFYEIICNRNEIYEVLPKKIRQRKIKCCLLVNHDEQLTVYQQILDKLGITDECGQLVFKPTSFINNYNSKDLVDVVFVDEAHLLLTQGKMSYQGDNQLKDILDRAKVVVAMFDSKQILTTEEYIDEKNIEEYRNKAKVKNSYINLTEQLRMRIDNKSMKWINNFIDKGIVEKIPKGTSKYEIKIFKTPKDLEEAIRKKAKNEKTSLSRLIATYDWPYIAGKKPKQNDLWEVTIEDWHKPWNRELTKKMTKEEKKRIKSLAWPEQPQTINEVGSTFTIQGFDLSYAGLIIGPSVKYRNGKIIFDPNASCNTKATQFRTMADGTKKKFGEMFLNNELNILMKRGVNGLYIYACDEELRNRLLECSK